MINEGLIEFEKRKPLLCGKILREFKSFDTDTTGWVKVDCEKEWCYKCGGIDGKIHRNRIASLFSRIEIDLISLKQIILTVPELDRHLFKSRKGMERLFNAGKRFKEKFYGKSFAIANMHKFGDKVRGKFHPHINIQVVVKRNTILRESKEKIKEMKETWKRQLEGMGCKNIKDLPNINFSFRNDNVSVVHSLRYMLRPPDVNHYNFINEEEEGFYMIDLKGFKNFREWGKKEIKHSDESMKEKENMLRNLLGGDVRFMGNVDYNEWKMTHIVGKDVVQVSEGIYIEKKT